MNHLDAPDHASLLCRRILVVEDDDGLYQALRDSLQDAGREVLAACERVSDPMDTAPASRLDAALVDMDPLGSARAASLSRQLGKRNIPIVWITSRRDARVASVVQTYKWISKPFTEQELLDSMARAVGAMSGDALTSQKSEPSAQPRT